MKYTPKTVMATAQQPDENIPKPYPSGLHPHGTWHDRYKLLLHKLHTCICGVSQDQQVHVKR